MTRRMLVDAAHPEETRVVVVDGTRVDEFDFEARAKRQIRSNIYLARVTRVEPSLQAAFVEYGGNRHGFLAFNEIHPDYYQIPYEDRQKLLEEAEAEERSQASADEGAADAAANGQAPEDADLNDDEDELAAGRARAQRAALRKYRIQEVIKRRQILLVQVVKEERGNKGAALTTYLSLAGRYGVLMPNTARGGGISRKITNASDRKRLRAIAEEMEVPAGMGLIVRTAGAKRTKSEIKRDYEYLLRLWETIRERTLNSMAPCLIHEEGNLVKRSIRDLYDKDIEQVLVEGDAAYREAKDFIRMLMPSHAKKVQPYKDPTPLFIAARVEDQLEDTFNPTVQLKSGGYLVINQTEALVAIDVNSGKATKERNIEATALKTNLEAAEEACRQMRLRDLAGLIVIDFIDMDDGKNNRAVEKRMRDCLKRDRARLQMGKISSFGLMELSRQRRRASLLEGSSVECPRCAGRGFVRSPASSALHVLRHIEEEGVKLKAARLNVRVAPDIALYIFNHKREHLAAIEERCAMTVTLEAAPELIPPDAALQVLETHAPGEAPTTSALVAAPPSAAVVEDDHEPAGDDEGGRRRRRRRRGRRRDDADAETAEADTPDADAGDDRDGDEEEEAVAARDDERDGEDDAKPKRGRRRRGRRGGRGRRTGGDGDGDGASSTADALRVVDPEGEFAASDAPVEPIAFAEPPAADADADEASAAPSPAAGAALNGDAKRATGAPLPPWATPAEGDVVGDDPAPSAAETPSAPPAETPAESPEAAAPTSDSPAAGAADEAAHKAGNPGIGPEDEPEGETEDGEPLWAAAQVQAPEPDPDAEKLRKRWANRLRTWVGG